LRLLQLDVGVQLPRSRSTTPEPVAAPHAVTAAEYQAEVAYTTQKMQELAELKEQLEGLRRKKAKSALNLLEELMLEDRGLEDEVSEIHSVRARRGRYCRVPTFWTH
jgi:hypothetical protein